MTTPEQSDVPYASELQVFSRVAEALDEIQIRIGPRFRRTEAQRRVRRFLECLLAPVERKNGWQLAEVLGERGPHGVQRLLYEVDWDQEAVRDELRAYVMEHLGKKRAFWWSMRRAFSRMAISQPGSPSVQRDCRRPRELPDQHLPVVCQLQKGGLHRSEALSA